MVSKATKPIINNRIIVNISRYNSKYLLDPHMSSVMSLVINFRKKPCGKITI